MRDEVKRNIITEDAARCFLLSMLAGIADKRTL